jgi:hypothetical protein
MTVTLEQLSGSEHFPGFERSGFNFSFEMSVIFKPEPEIEPETKPDPEMDPVPEMDPETKPDPEMDPEPEIEQETKPDPEPEIEPKLLFPVLEDKSGIWIKMGTAFEGCGVCDGCGFGVPAPGMVLPVPCFGHPVPGIGLPVPGFGHPVLGIGVSVANVLIKLSSLKS